MDLTTCDPRRLRFVDDVCARLLTQSPQLQPSDLMVVGAHCRDVLHDAMGYRFALRVTEDLDMALAIADWRSYKDLVDGLTPVGDTGIRYRVGVVPTDLLPFGPVEDPAGVVVPSPRNEEMSVWAFQEVFDTAHELSLPTVGSIRIPTVAGYAALKLGAWLDRSEIGQYKDATDIATILYWYTTSTAVEDRIYATDHGIQLLTDFGLDRDLAAARLLGEDVAATIGARRVAELASRWPGRRDHVLAGAMEIPAAPNGWTALDDRRQELLDAMARSWAVH